MNPNVRFSYETHRPCPTCKRDVDAVRSPMAPGLQYSRHFGRDAKGFCAGSLTDVEDRARR